jgi:hypothetical protein
MLCVLLSSPGAPSNGAVLLLLCTVCLLLILKTVLCVQRSHVSSELTKRSKGMAKTPHVGEHRTL